MLPRGPRQRQVRQLAQQPCEGSLVASRDGVGRRFERRNRGLSPGKGREMGRKRAPAGKTVCPSDDELRVT